MANKTDNNYISVNELYSDISFIGQGRGNDPMPVFTGADNVFIMKPYKVSSEVSSSFEPTDKLRVLDNIVTWSMSYNADRSQVRTNGRKTISGITSGALTIGGSIITNYIVTPNLLNAHPFFQHDGSKYVTNGEINDDFLDRLKDILMENGTFILTAAAPFDIYIRSNNESGYEVGSIIYGINILSGAEIRNIHDLTVEVNYQYVAFGATATLPAKVTDSLVATYNHNWYELINTLDNKNNSYGFLSIE